MNSSIRSVASLLIMMVAGIGCSKQFNDAGSSQLENVPVSYDTSGKVMAGVPTNSSVTLNLLFPYATECSVSYGISPDALMPASETISLSAGVPKEMVLRNLQAGKKYFYRLHYKEPGSSTSQSSPLYSFVTQRQPGASFSFGVQGDSHPERTGKMFSSDLYKTNMRNVSSQGVDMYFTMGDDFSLQRLIQFNTANQLNVEGIYALQRPYLGMVASNASVFLVNGNHEEAAMYRLDGTATNPAVLAGNARKKFFPVPQPGSIYTGDANPLNFVGNLADYYAFNWGDALFVVIDPYWHTPVNGDLWDITLGKEQYDWFKATLLNSTAKFKFVFTHHVLGTGRGGIEMANLAEWGGRSPNGQWEFDKFRPGWNDPIHQIMVKAGVTVFFQAHDHLYCRQELDGIVYQSVPNPADDTYTAFNDSAYTSGVKLPNSGFLKVQVSPQSVKVDYINAVLPANESTTNRNGMIRHSYTITK
ncbi:MAG TPA: hypothetical protein VLL95_02425 [Phnomibacter sp.]|nr:hypothetical protein [Phnomibacter sp.]